MGIIDVKTVTEARKDLYNLVDSVEQNCIPTMIVGKRSKAVLIGESEWRSIQETLHLYSIPGMVESIKEGLAEPKEEAVKLETWRDW
jgi:antitoxin YefM